MAHTCLASVAFLVAGSFFNACVAQTVPEFTMTSLSASPDQSAVSVQVVGGFRASPADWPSTFVFTGNNKSCTATAIGAQVVLVAAHCVSDGSTGKIEEENFSSDVTCNQSPQYKSNTSADYALCKVTAALPVKPANYFETLATNPAMLPAYQAQITLLGFGCSGAVSNSLTLFEGLARVTAPMTSGTNLYVTTYADLDQSDHGAALCAGDSGGGAFYPTQNQSRRLIAVSSKGTGSTSFFSNTANDTFVTWAKSWPDPQAPQKHPSICGLDSGAQNCHP